MKNRHGPKGGRGSSIYRCSRRGDERVMRTNAEIADLNCENSDDDQDNDDEGNDGLFLILLHVTRLHQYFS